MVCTFTETGEMEILKQAEPEEGREEISPITASSPRGAVIA